MAKKKQLSGKTTRLAKLALTAALSRQGEETASVVPPLPSPDAPARQMAFAWKDEAEENRVFLPTAYLQIVQEIEDLQFELAHPAQAQAPSFAHLLPPQMPPAAQLRKALRQAQQEIAALHRLLSCEP